MNAVAEMPSISASTYNSSALALHGLQGATATARRDDYFEKVFDKPKATQSQPEKTSMTAPALRFVKIYIADVDENLPLNKRMLFTGEETFTDLTDQELFFDVPIVTLLTEHNALRAVTLDKTKADKFGRDVFLEPVRIRDLKMVVATLASF